MELPEDLKFKNEEDRVATIEKYEAEGGSNPDDIQRIMDAALDESAKTADEVAIEDIPVTDEALPATEATADPSDVPPEQQETAARQWSVGEEDIPKDTYFDKKEGKVRPFITQKNFGDFTKSYISGQKRIHYLEDILLPQERQVAQSQAQAEIDRLKAENEKLRQAPAPVPVPAAAPPVSKDTTTPPVGENAKALAEALAELKDVDREDMLAHIDKLHNAQMATLQHTNSLTDSYNKLMQNGKSVDARFQTIEQQRAAEEEQRASVARSQEAQNNWDSACRLVDSFAQTNADFKSDFGQTNQSFGDMTKEAMDFHINLAGMMFNKHPQQITNEEQRAASQEYLRGDEQLKQKAAQYGLDEPTNYRAWVELDQVDAMRTGMYRDPVSKQWQQVLDPVTQKPVLLGDMGTAYGRYLDVSGKRNEKIQALLKSQSDSLAGAIARRDTGITSMDTNKLQSDGTGADITEQQAVDVLAQIDSESAMGEYMRTGNKEKLEQLNRAFGRLGMQPLEIPDVTPDARK